MKEYLLTREEMGRYDSNTINILGIPTYVLMERAADSLARFITCEFADRSLRILVCCGNGNNGGDGVAIARILKEYGYNPDIYITVAPDRYCESVRFQTGVAGHLGITPLDTVDAGCYDLIVDALFGIGLNRDITGDTGKLIDDINKATAKRISVDIPSGIDSNTGSVRGTAVKADVTVTFGFYKRGQFLGDGPLYCGRLIKTCIGIGEHSFLGNPPLMYTYMKDGNKIDLYRDPMGNKGSFGKVLIIAGRSGMSGACILAAGSALRSGCGMVAVLTEECNRSDIIRALPECIVHTYNGSSDIADTLISAASWADAVAIGPGIGTDKISEELVKCLIDNVDKPLIIDADAINVLSGNAKLQTRLLDMQHSDDTVRSIIFTPHLKEFERISGMSVSDIRDDRVKTSTEFADRFKSCIVLKDAYTTVSDGSSIYLNIYNNDAMATAGSGDVLTGLTASIVAQYVKKKDTELTDLRKPYSCYSAAAMAVYIHSMAGLKAAEELGHSAMIAGDVIDRYYEVIV